MKLFVYGTLKKGHGNDRILRGSRFIGMDILKGFEMRCLGYFPAINKDEDSSVHGEVYEISADILHITDRLEGYPTHYDREAVQTEGGHEVFVYFYSSKRQELPLVAGGIW